MDELNERYDDLNNLIENLKYAESEHEYKEFADEILDLIRRIEIRVEEIEPQICRQQSAELRELENEFERSRLC